MIWFAKCVFLLSFPFQLWAYGSKSVCIIQKPSSSNIKSFDQSMNNSIIKFGYPLLTPYPKIVIQRSTSLHEIRFGNEFIIEHPSQHNHEHKDQLLYHHATQRFCSIANSVGFIEKRHQHDDMWILESIDTIQLNVNNVNDYFDSIFVNTIQNLQHFQIDSFYSIEIHPLNSSLAIKYFHPAGYNHAITTLSQIFTMSSTKITSLLYLPLTILDWPTYQYRGLLIDVSRHFIPIDQLKRQIAAMHAVKMNVLHLHLTDAQSFPILFDDVTLPTQYNISKNNLVNTEELFSDGKLLLSRLGMMGSFDSTKLYSKQDLSDLVQYSRKHNIDIIPEIDMPAHAKSWSHAFHNFIVNCSTIAQRAEVSDNIYPLDPTNELLYVVIAEIIKQITVIFPSQYIHVGGDEVEDKCWKESKKIKSYMTEYQIISTAQLFKYFETRVFEIVRSLDRIPVVWQGVQDSNSLPNESSEYNHPAIVQPWKCWGGLASRSAQVSVETNHPIIMSACWYLDFDKPWNEYLTVNILDEVQATATLYKASTLQATDPTETSVSSKPSKIRHKTLFGNHFEHELNLFLGGEASIWTENVDHTNFDCRVWPRAGIVASHLWGSNLSNYGDTSYLKESDYSWTNDSNEMNSAWKKRHMPANLVSTKHLFSSYVHLRYYLQYLHISPAPFIFHYTLTTLSNRKLNPKFIRSEYDALSRIMLLNNSVYLGSRPADFGSFVMTAQCSGIPQSIQRPLWSDRISLVQFNVAEGSTGSRGTVLLEWLQGKAKEGVVAVGFCELNNWQILNSETDPLKNKPLLAFRAASAGFAYSYIMTNSQPYHIGIASALPFEVIAEYGPPKFQRGVLHVYFTKIDLHVLITHLHAHSSILREAEAQIIISEIVKPLIFENTEARIVIMGDFNTLSSEDKEYHSSTGLLGLLSRTDHPVFERLKKKYLDSFQRNINYKPLDILLSNGFCDSCIEYCRFTAQNNVSNNYDKSKTSDYFRSSLSTSETECFSSMMNWTETENEIFSNCKHEKCSHTEPTAFNPEWPILRDNLSHPKIRLDYILLSQSLVNQIKDSFVNNRNIKNFEYNSFIDINNLTDIISDHYPVYASWKDSSLLKV